nr:MAG TPA: hypothetical protein [Caudoviricetes sp.]
MFTYHPRFIGNKTTYTVMIVPAYPHGLSNIHSGPPKTIDKHIHAMPIIKRQSLMQHFHQNAQAYHERKIKNICNENNPIGQRFSQSQSRPAKVANPQHPIAYCKRYKHPVNIHKRGKANNSNISVEDRKETQITK